MHIAMGVCLHIQQKQWKGKSRLQEPLCWGVVEGNSSAGVQTFGNWPPSVQEAGTPLCLFWLKLLDPMISNSLGEWSPWDGWWIASACTTVLVCLGATPHLFYPPLPFLLPLFPNPPLCLCSVLSRYPHICFHFGSGAGFYGSRCPLWIMVRIQLGNW